MGASFGSIAPSSGLGRVSFQQRGFVWRADAAGGRPGGGRLRGGRDPDAYTARRVVLRRRRQLRAAGPAAAGHPPSFQNVEVLATLVKLTGQDFGYDIPTWKRWVSHGVPPRSHPRPPRPPALTAPILVSLGTPVAIPLNVETVRRRWSSSLRPCGHERPAASCRDHRRRVRRAERRAGAAPRPGPGDPDRPPESPPVPALLYQVATAALNPSDIASPIRRILRGQKNAEVLLAEVDGRSTSEAKRSSWPTAARCRTTT